MRPTRPHRATIALALLVTGTVLVAGCTGSNPQPAPNGGGTNPTPTGSSPTGNGTLPGNVTGGVGGNGTAPGVVVFPITGTVTGALAVVVYLNAPVSSASFPFTVDAGAAAILTELTWSDATMDLDPLLAAPSCDVQMGTGNCNFDTDGSHGMGDSPIRYVVAGEPVNETGEWTIVIFAKNAVNTSFTGAISVFYGSEPDDSYTALTTRSE